MKRVTYATMAILLVLAVTAVAATAQTSFSFGFGFGVPGGRAIITFGNPPYCYGSPYGYNPYGYNPYYYSYPQPSPYFYGRSYNPGYGRYFVAPRGYGHYRGYVPRGRGRW